MIKPKALRIGDTIGIVSPSSPIVRQKVIDCIEKFKKIGFKIKVGRSVYQNHGYLSGKDDIRAMDINNMFEDKSVNAIFCTRGGYGALRILEKINYDIIKENPKVFIGYSDITALHISINQNSKLITFHGPMVSCGDIDEVTKKFLIRNIMDINPLGKIKNPYERVIKILVGGVCEGIIVGGNLSVVVSTLGTKYEINTKNKILFLEDVNEEPYKIDRMITQLALAGKFKDANGIILGNFKNCFANNQKKSLSLNEIFEEIIMPFNKPTIYNLEIGHCKPYITIPLGVNARLNAFNGELNILESGVCK